MAGLRDFLAGATPTPEDTRAEREAFLSQNPVDQSDPFDEIRGHRIKLNSVWGGPAVAEELSRRGVPQNLRSAAEFYHDELGLPRDVPVSVVSPMNAKFLGKPDAGGVTDIDTESWIPGTQKPPHVYIKSDQPYPANLMTLRHEFEHVKDAEAPKPLDLSGVLANPWAYFKHAETKPLHHDGWGDEFNYAYPAVIQARAMKAQGKKVGSFWDDQISQHDHQGSSKAGFEKTIP